MSARGGGPRERRERPGRIAGNGDGTASLAGYDAVAFGVRFLRDADVLTQQQAWDPVTAQSAADGLWNAPGAGGWRGVDSTFLLPASSWTPSRQCSRSAAS